MVSRQSRTLAGRVSCRATSFSAFLSGQTGEVCDRGRFNLKQSWSRAASTDAKSGARLYVRRIFAGGPDLLFT